MGGEMLYSRAVCKGAPLTRQVVKKGCVAPLRGAADRYRLSAVRLMDKPCGLEGSKV